MMKKILLLMSVLALIPVGAKDYPVDPQKQLKLEMTVPAPVDGERVILRFLARLQGEMKIGGQYATRISVDGKTLDYTVNTVPRVVNRKAPTFHGTVYPYTSKGVWNTAANPREEYIEIVYVPEDYSQVYYYELDITDIPPGRHEFCWENVDTEKRILRVRDPGIIVKRAADLPLGVLRDFRPSVKGPDARIASDGGTCRWEFEMPEIKDRKAVLRFRSRLDAGNGWGYNQDLQVTLNGKPLGSRTAAKGRRLLNRNASAFLGQKVPAISSTGRICVFHHNNFEIPAKHASKDREQAHWCYLDISDLVNHSGKNVLVFKNFAQNRNFKGYPKGKPEIVIDSCEVGTVGSRVIEAMPDDVIRKWSSSPSIKTREYEIAVVKEGLGIQISHCGKHYYFESAASYPDGGMNRLSCLGGSAAGKEPGWQISYSRAKDSFTVKGRGKHYEWTREIICRPHAVKVRDTFRSLSKEITGICFSNLVIPEQRGGKVFRAGVWGNTSSTGNHDNPAPNSTLFFQNGSGLGIVVEDDIFRLQCGFKVKDDGTASFGTDHLGFQPKASHTLEWSIYPTRSGDYFDFVNAVRKDWNVGGQTIPGAIAWPILSGKPATLRTFLNHAGTAFPALYWFDLDRAPKDPSIPLETRIKGYGKTIRLYREVTDQPIVFMFQTALMRRNLRSRPLEFADSCVIGPDGKVAEYSSSFRGKLPGQYHVLRYYTLENSYFKYIMDIITIALKMGIRGFYFDTPNHINSHYGRFTYDRWDGCTVDLDSKFRVKRKYADLCLISGPARYAIAQRILKAGGIVFYNDPPMLRKMTELKGNVVFLTEGDVPFCFARQHFCTPIAFGEHYSDRAPTRPLYGRRKTWQGAADLMDDIVWKLKYGVLYQLYRAPLNDPKEKISSVILDHAFPTAFMYPITVTDVHAGWVRGKERIITCVSGKYRWPDNPNQAELRLFDLNGRNISTAVRTPDQDGKFAISVPEKGMAILIRK